MWKNGRDDSGVVQDIFRNGFVLENSLKSILHPKPEFLFFLKSQFVSFSSITHLLSHTFEDPSCRICSYGPCEPFRFSVKFSFDMEMFYQKYDVGEK